MITNSVDAYEMLIVVASHLGLHCLILSHFLNAMLKWGFSGTFVIHTKVLKLRFKNLTYCPTWIRSMHIIIMI